MSDIFISYASEDKLRVEPLAKALEDCGWSVWWDPHIPAGKRFDEVIEQAINDARCIIVVWSGNSVSSAWVRAEASEGIDRQILVPVMIEEVRIPLAFRQIQAARLIGWDGSSSHSGFDKLVKDISLIVSPPSQEMPVIIADQHVISPPHVDPELKVFKVLRYLSQLAWRKIGAGLFAIALLTIVIAIYKWTQTDQNTTPNVDSRESRSSVNENSLAGKEAAPNANVTSNSGRNTGNFTQATVATWNVQGFDAIPDDKANRLARAIADLDPALIVLTEVNPNSVAAKFVDALKNIGVTYNFTLLEQTATQNIALLYKTDVAVSNAQLIPHSDDDKPSLRKALTASVRIGQFDFIVVAIHLKSGRASDGQEVRTRQGKVIADFIRDATQGSEKDVLVIGDYNMVPQQDQVNFDAMSHNRFLRFISNELSPDQFSHISSAEPPRGSMIDGFAISREYTKEYVNGTIQVFPLYQSLEMSLGTYRNEISDHLPLIAKFRVLTNDD